MKNNDKLTWRAWEEFGEGPESVYLYYFPSQKEDAQKTGQPFWECKVGKADKDAFDRIQRQLKYENVRQKRGVGDTEEPEIPLIFKTYDCRKLERRIHKILKVFDRGVPNEQEWFYTTPEEVIQIYLFVADFLIIETQQKAR